MYYNASCEADCTNVTNSNQVTICCTNNNCNGIPNSPISYLLMKNDSDSLKNLNSFFVVFKLLLIKILILINLENIS